ncbi:MAG: Asp-tRNA(Asn)/Glu-tRNA(Gln) amidotransferase subunit GatC [Rickettsiales bacterium]|nr:Asp-tRNA(Asn)/Glu-tRNA(Gln) amidotransferase subunit GatC [Rickettsiales bacterium]
MSEVSKQQVEKIAKLARIKLSENEKEFFAGEVGKIITWVEKLNEVNTDDVSAIFEGSKSLNMFDDVVKHNDLSEEVLKNSPERQFDFFAVPKMVDDQ